jgi:hypothetical protein
MALARNRVSRFLADSRPQAEPIFFQPLSNFYREEFVKCQRCLDAHREYYSERTISEVEKALTKVLAQLDRLCAKEDADKIVSALLQRFDTLTRLSAWSDPRQIH